MSSLLNILIFIVENTGLIIIFLVGLCILSILIKGGVLISGVVLFRMTVETRKLQSLSAL